MTTTPPERRLFSDDDLRATLDGRIRQLEGEREGTLIALAEVEADPHAGRDDKAQLRRNAESLTARLAVVLARRAELDPAED